MGLGAGGVRGWGLEVAEEFKGGVFGGVDDAPPGGTPAAGGEEGVAMERAVAAMVATHHRVTQDGGLAPSRGRGRSADAGAEVRGMASAARLV